MIRRDYILRMIQEFMQILSRLKALKQGERWQEASTALDEEFNRLAGGGAQAVARLTETELLARLMQGEPTQIVHTKTIILTALLKEAGDVAAAEHRDEASRAYYLKGLHLLLYSLASADAGDSPDFVPKIEVFVAALEGSPLPLEAQVLLMQHYEQTGQFGKAEDVLFTMLDAAPGDARLLEFGKLFYDRLQNQSDASLSAGGLPRVEVEAGLAELSSRKTAPD